MIQTVEISMQFRKHIQVSVVKISSCGSLYFWSYTPWKLGFVASPETSQKHLFRVKTSQLIHNRSKFSKTKCISYITIFIILCKSLRSIQQIFRAGHALQGRSLE
jgi:hypothetical protein